MVSGPRTPVKVGVTGRAIFTSLDGPQDHPGGRHRRFGVRQLAAAFARASLLAGIGKPSEREPARARGKRQQAAALQSGAKAQYCSLK